MRDAQNIADILVDPEGALERRNHWEKTSHSLLVGAILGLYRDTVVARVTGRSDWRIGDLVDGPRPISLYLVVPPSDIARTKPLLRLVLNQIGRLTESLDTERQRQKLLLMLDEADAFPLQ